LTDVREIDVLHLGRERVICCFQAGDVIVDPGPEVTHRTVLDALGAEVPRAILLTHIHLDHAGATGALVRHWPEVEVWVHERGAPHVIDPSRLVASATRLYGDDMQRLWGEIVPVPEANVRVLSGGEAIGPWRVEYTPGHAMHHVSYLHEPTGVAYVGDTGGVRIGDGPVFPPTPPPDIDVEGWHRSIATIAAWQPERLAVTHFGVHDGAADQLAAMHEGLDRWAAYAREVDGDTYSRAIVEEMSRSGEGEAFMQAMPPDTLWPGLQRYWSKREAAS
jgi:glyoxylase-like metal-dependent hydrolase (beta-lactamase superfamily II)